MQLIDWVGQGSMSKVTADLIIVVEMVRLVVPCAVFILM